MNQKSVSRQQIIEAIESSPDMKTAAETLGMSKAAIYARLSNYGLKVTRTLKVVK